MCVCICCELKSLGDISYRDVCLLSSIIGLGGTRLVVLKCQKKYIWKVLNQCLFPKIMTGLLRIMHRPRCKQFHAGTTFFRTYFLCLTSSKFPDCWFMGACAQANGPADRICKCKQLSGNMYRIDFPLVLMYYYTRKCVTEVEERINLCLSFISWVSLTAWKQNQWLCESSLLN